MSQLKVRRACANKVASWKCSLAPAAKDAVCLFRHPSVVYALANLHRGPAGRCAGRGPDHTGSARRRAGGHSHMRERTYRRTPLVLGSSATSFIAIVHADRPLPHRVEMLSLSTHTHRECNKRFQIRIDYFQRTLTDLDTIQAVITHCVVRRAYCYVELCNEYVCWLISASVAKLCKRHRPGQRAIRHGCTIRYDTVR